MSVEPSPPPRRPGSRGLVIGRFVGAPVVVTTAWPVGAIVLVALFGPTVNDVLPGSELRGYVVAAGYALLLFLSVLLHEGAHAAVAHQQGKQVHEISLTLWGGQTSYSDDAPRPGSAILVSLAGPLTNLVLGVVAWFVVDQTALTDGHPVPRLLVGALAWSNLFVGAFNLVPGLPLDGGQVLEGIVWRLSGRRTTGTLVAGWIGRVVAGLVVLGFIVVPMARGAQPSVFSIVWALLIGTFLWQGASAAIASATLRQGIESIDLRSLVHPVVAVPTTALLADVVGVLTQHHAEVAASGPAPAYGQRSAGLEPVVLVTEAGRLVGTVDPTAMRSVPAASLAGTPASAVAVPLAPGAAVHTETPETELTARAALLSRRASVIVVVTGGEVSGALLSAEIQARLRENGIGA